MTRVHPLLAAILLWAVAAPVVHAGPPESTDSFGPLPSIAAMQQSASEVQPVRARLFALDTAVAPASTVRVGLHLAHDPQWHSYWKNGGDSGLPTELFWNLPGGFTASPIVWPTPERYLDAADLVSYGYKEDVVLFVDLGVPANASGVVELTARADWLMCKELCIPGTQDVSLTLHVGGPSRPASAADQALWAASAARLPVPAASIENPKVRAVLDVTALPPGQSAHAAVVIEGLTDPASVQWTWFPEAIDGLFPARESGQVDGERLIIGSRLRLEPNGYSTDVLDWGGVVDLLEQDGTRHFVEVDLPIHVAAAGEAVEAVEPELFAALLGVDVSGSGGLFAQDFGATSGASRGLIYYLLLALVGGVILNVMPCVLPVLSLKVMSFVRHAGEDRGVQFRLGLTFTAGVLASFLALAAVVIALQTAGDQLGWGFQFQNPAFVVVMAAVVFAFGLSLFGVYEIVLPVQLGGGGRGGAYAESFFNGVLATALATPCTAPFLGTALGFAFTQPAVAILAIFLTIGLGLSLPYVILSLNPRLLRFVPKPGAWMDRFKQAMGFLLMATLVWLLWVLGQQIGVDGVVWTMVFLLCLGFALWLYGAALNLSSSTRRRAIVWGVMIVIVVGAWRGFLADPLSSEAIASVHARTADATHADGSTQWRPFSVATLEQEVRAGNTVFIDFTAAWCTTCKVNEKTVLDTEPVRTKLEELGVVPLLGDWTNRDEEITKVLRQFGRSGVPFYAVFPAGRLDAPIVLPEIITQDIVLDALDRAGASRRLAASR
jgi:thiol:disulfide interchange protein/DsbC/DsbD-like thiol-disulfide interchange protein